MGRDQMNRAVFLDRDGVLNHDFGYTYRIQDLQVLPGVVQALTTLEERGFTLVVVTNQSGVGRGRYTDAHVYQFNHALARRIHKMGGPHIRAFYACPHHPDRNCKCRKPSPWMLQKAAEDLGINLGQSFMVGDKPEDVQAGVAAGVISGIQVETNSDELLTKAVPLILDFAEF